MKRRTFLQALLGTGLMGAVSNLQASPLKSLWTSPNELDGDTVVFLSDLHCNPDGYQPAHLKKIVGKVLQMNPLPKQVICLGDLAYLTGQIHEYQHLRPLLEPLWKAGIEVTMAMGNHDRREEFATVFPEFASKSRLKDRLTFVVETPAVDFIVLDSLQQGEDKSTWITPGALDDGQRSWLQAELNGRQKPVVVCAHHPIHELGIESMLLTCPQCCGFIHGHDHRWRPEWSILNYKTPLVLRRLCLPSTGHWGDIGYAVLKIQPDRLAVKLEQDEFFFPEPMPEGQPVPSQWKMIVDDHKGEVCTFNLHR